MTDINRRASRPVMVGRVQIGGGAPISIQSMANTDTRDAEATARQVQALAGAGCDIVRVAVFDQACAAALRDIKARCPGVPIVADVHFDYRLAVAAIENGADKLRINPGNIGDSRRVRIVAQAAKAHGVPIRVGVNAASLAGDKLDRFGGPTVEAMVESALENIRTLESCGFQDIVVALKASGVAATVGAYRMMADACPYPLHLGVTEAGTMSLGVIKSAIGIGSLLLDGIGDTLRVSLTADPLREVEAALAILKGVGLSRGGIEIIACPTCGRTRMDVQALASEVEHALAHIKAPLRVAVMGCAVNGPGEARGADIGVACGEADGLLFKGGQALYKVAADKIVESLVREAEEIDRITG